MAKISTTKKIAIEGFPSTIRSWIGMLVDPVNKFFEQTYFAISKGLTIADNLKAQKFDMEIAVNQVYPMKLTWSLNERPTTLVLGYIAEVQSSGTLPVHCIQWTYNDGTIDVTFTGLDPTKKYKAVLVGQV